MQLAGAPKADLSRSLVSQLPPLNPKSDEGHRSLGGYIRFLTWTSDRIQQEQVLRYPKATSASHSRVVELEDDSVGPASTTMNPATTSKDDASSPLHYDAKQTALLLLDFQTFIINMCGAGGESAVQKANLVREWALQQGILVLHSIIDIDATPTPTYKGLERIKGMLAHLKSNTEAAKEPAEIAFGQYVREYLVLKQPGIVSALKSRGAMDLLRENGIKSLIICGLSTSGAVLSTTLQASDEGFVVSVVEDGCACPDKKDKRMLVSEHEWLTTGLLAQRATVMSAEQLMKMWGGK